MILIKEFTLNFGHFYHTQFWSLSCLVSHSITQCCLRILLNLLDLSKLLDDFFKFLNGFVKIDKLISLNCYMDLSKLIHRFLLIVTWICQNWYMDFFSNFLHGFVKIDYWMDFCYIDLSKLFYVFLPLLPIKTKLECDNDFKTCWSFCFGLKVLNESKYSMPWVRCAYGNV